MHYQYPSSLQKFTVGVFPSRGDLKGFLQNEFALNTLKIFDLCLNKLSNVYLKAG